MSLQVVLVSATLPAEVLEMTNKFMTDPVRVLVKRDELTLEVGAPGFSLGPNQTTYLSAPLLHPYPIPRTCHTLLAGHQAILCGGGARGVEV